MSDKYVSGDFTTDIEKDVTGDLTTDIAKDVSGDLSTAGFRNVPSTGEDWSNFYTDEV